METRRANYKQLVREPNGCINASLFLRYEHRFAKRGSQRQKKKLTLVTVQPGPDSYDFVYINCFLWPDSLVIMCDFDCDLLL